MTKKQNSQHPFIQEILEKYTTLPEGIPVWKTIGVEITKENFAENLFFLSTDLAAHFSMRHDNFCTQIIVKLLNEGYLTDHFLTGKEMVEIGSAAKRAKIVHGLNCHQTQTLVLDLFNPELRAKKFALFLRLQNLGDELPQHDVNENVADDLLSDTNGIPLLSDTLEIYQKTPEGLFLWKTKNLPLTCENLLENIFLLSDDMADYFGMLHKNFVKQNLHKLFQEKHIDHALKVKRMIAVGKSAFRSQIVYGLTRQDSEIVITDFTGPRLRQKKIAIIKRLHGIETDVLHGAFADALQKAQNWHGVELLQEMGLKPSLPGNLASKEDIAQFLKVPKSSLSTFLRRREHEIKAIPLTREQIRAIGSRASKMNGYNMEETFKITYYMDTTVGIDIKKKIHGRFMVCAKAEPKGEVAWRKSFLQIFDGFGLHSQYPIADYHVDFFVAALMLVLEYDGEDSHSSYNAEEEAARERAITRRYALIRFNDQTSVESLVNAILKIKPRHKLKLYSNEVIGSEG